MKSTTKWSIIYTTGSHFTYIQFAESLQMLRKLSMRLVLNITGLADDISCSWSKEQAATFLLQSKTTFIKPAATLASFHDRLKQNKPYTCLLGYPSPSTCHKQGSSLHLPSSTSVSTCVFSQKPNRVVENSHRFSKQFIASYLVPYVWQQKGNYIRNCRKKEAGLLLKKKNLGPFKNYKVLGLPEITEQEIYA